MSLPDPVLSFIILAWNSEAFLAHCFDSILAKCAGEGIPCEIIAIDNGSRDGSGDIIRGYRQSHPGVFHLIVLENNCGTTVSRNLGLRQARGAFICVLDSDTELEQGCLSELLERLGKDAGIGIIAPRLLLPDGNVQHSVKRFPTMLHKLLKIPRICFGIKTGNHDFYEDFPFAEARAADTAISACWFMTRGVMERVGALDEKIFYSPEDLDYSRRVWKAGYSILYYPDFTVLHHTQQITHKKPFSRTSRSHFFGLLYYYRKHGGWVIRPKTAVPGSHPAASK